MRRLGALAAVTAMALGSVAALMATWPYALALLAVAFLVLRDGRRSLLLFTLLAVLFQVALFGLFVGLGDARSFGPFAFFPAGAVLGAQGAVRLAAVLGLNLAVLSRWPAPAILDALPMPRRPRAFLGAVLIAVQDLRDEGERIVEGRRVEGQWPEGRFARVRAAAAMVPAVLVAAERRARIRREALRVAGIDVGRRFAPLVAVTALALVGRIVFAPVPNISPTFLFVFLGGLLFGPLVGVAAGALSMAISNALLSGLLPTAYVNVPAMAVLGLVGGACRPLVRGPPRVTAVLAGALGAAVTILFSVAADSATWAVVPEYRTTPGAWKTLVFGGLLFNVVPALANAALFAASVGPVAAAFRRLRSTADPSATAATASAAPPAARAP